MRISVTVFLLIFSILSGCKEKDALVEGSSLEGLSGITKEAWGESNFKLFKSGASKEKSLARYIQYVLDNENKPFKAAYAVNLAHWIFLIAKEVNIDPIVFAGLVAHESRFDPTAKNVNSKGVFGGAGLTQLTSVAVREINDQWDAKTNKKGDVMHSKDVHDFILNMKKKSPFSKSLVKLSTPAQAILPNSRISSLIYGAILLKLILTNIVKYDAAMKLCVNAKDKNLGNGPYKYYRAALACYNGHQINKILYPGKVLAESNGVIKGTALTSDIDGLSLAGQDDDADYINEPTKDVRRVLGAFGNIRDIVTVQDDDDAVTASTFGKDAFSDEQCWSIQVHALEKELNVTQIKESLAWLPAAYSKLKIYTYKKAILQSPEVSINVGEEAVDAYQQGDMAKAKTFNLVLLGKFAMFSEASTTLESIRKELSDEMKGKFENAWLRLTTNSEFCKGDATKFAI